MRHAFAHNSTSNTSTYSTMMRLFCSIVNSVGRHIKGLIISSLRELSTLLPANPSRDFLHFPGNPRGNSSRVFVPIVWLGRKVDACRKFAFKFSILIHFVRAKCLFNSWIRFSLWLWRFSKWGNLVVFNLKILCVARKMLWEIVVIQIIAVFYDNYSNNLCTIIQF